MSLKSFLENRVKVKLTLLVVTVVILYLTGSQNFVNHIAESVYFRVIGQTNPDTNVVIIHINENDIDRLGGWPLKRSYYALLIDKLNRLRVSRIGVEVMFASSSATQSIYDSLLLNKIKSAGNVVLASYPQFVEGNDGLMTAKKIEYPSFKKPFDSLETGHLIYFGMGDRINIPIQIRQGNFIEEAFFYKLLDSSSRSGLSSSILVNAVSSWKKFRNYSLTEFFDKDVAGDPELESLRGKTILIGVTDPKYTNKVLTPFDNDLPGIALHAFAVENVLQNNYIRTGFYNTISILFLFLVAFVILFIEKFEFKFQLSAYITMFIIFTFLGYAFFYLFGIEINYSFYAVPLVGMYITESIYRLKYKGKLLEKVTSEAKLLKNILHKKEADLKALLNELELSNEATSGLVLERIKSLKDDIRRLKSKEADDNQDALNFDADEVKNFCGIIYRSKAITEIVDTINKVAKSDATILLLGESGTGKELVAKAIHASSNRSGNSFIAVNCGALSETLLESELFGHVKGSFTGAFSDKIGRFEAADKGTIFLDEIGEISENFQVKLLRVIQTGTLERVGSSKTIKIDVRIIAATNVDLEKAVAEKRFREDLFYRLNVIKIVIPPLRQRTEDVEVLVDYFIKTISPDFRISGAALNALINYSWQGNVRQLESVMKRSLVFTKALNKSIIQISDLPDEITKEFDFDYEDLVLESLRMKHFSHASFTETAKELQASRTLISENFRGIVLKNYVLNNFDPIRTASAVAGDNNPDTFERVQAKLQVFLRNISTDVQKAGSNEFDYVKMKLGVKYKNLPKKFHSYLDTIIRSYLQNHELSRDDLLT
ncbi:MAG: sigma 54-interacting transcriptional regulator [Ignavibacteriaceae bacterium]|nr:sigma 54-interacting transcriptional regulator [Ignavibacteriaceae bacterium]